MTSITIHIPNKEVGFFKKIMEKFGWVYHIEERPKLIDPETGDALNDKTMKAIEDANQGKGIEFTGTVDEFKDWAKSL